jgi:hypothetical protein
MFSVLLFIAHTLNERIVGEEEEAKEVQHESSDEAEEEHQDTSPPSRKRHRLAKGGKKDSVPDWTVKAIEFVCSSNITFLC